jgi:type IV pilus assembly protein PilC
VYRAPEARLMQTYVFTAHDINTGQKISADIEADSEQSAAKLLVERGLTPLDIRPSVEQSSLGNFRNRVPTKQKVIFSRQLSTLINAGLPLVQSLQSVAGQTHNKTLKAILESVISEVEGGGTLSQSLARYPRVFNEVYVSLVAAGEASGTLDKSLERLANQQEKDAEIIAKVRGAMIYPILVLVVLCLVIVFMLTTILPQVENLYDSLPGAKLPFVTVVLLKVAHFIINDWWVLIVVLIIGALATTRWARTVGGKRAIDRIKLNMPPIKELFRKLYMARFARTASTLVASGIPMIKMLNTTARAVGNVHVAESINRAADEVKTGKNLSDSLKGDPNFLDLVPDMIKIGEQSGSLEGMLNKTADYYEKEVDNQIKAISTIIEPTLMVIVGVMALIVVAAVLLPIYGLAGKNLLKPH